MAEWTPKRARQFCRQKLSTMEATLEGMHRQWGDLTAESIVTSALEDLAAAIQSVRSAMDEAVDYAAECEAEARADSASIKAAAAAIVAASTGGR